jgi:hypothetical protein
MNEHMEKTNSVIQVSMYSVVALRQLLTVTSRYTTSMVFHGKWDAADTGRFANILPRISLRTWFVGQKENRKFFLL